MPTAGDNLRTRRDAIALELASGGDMLGWKPNVSLDGESVSWADYRKGLLDEIEQLTKLIQQVEGPFIVRRRGRA